MNELDQVCVDAMQNYFSAVDSLSKYPEDVAYNRTALVEQLQAAETEEERNELAA